MGDAIPTLSYVNMRLNHWCSLCNICHSSYQLSSYHMSCHPVHRDFDYVACTEYLIHRLQHWTSLRNHIHDLCCFRPGYGSVVQKSVLAFSRSLGLFAKFLHYVILCYLFLNIEKNRTQSEKSVCLFSRSHRNKKHRHNSARTSFVTDRKIILKIYKASLSTARNTLTDLRFLLCWLFKRQQIKQKCYMLYHSNGLSFKICKRRPAAAVRTFYAHAHEQTNK